MPLSEEELRLLEQMERALVAEDPKFVSTIRGTSFQRSARRRTVLAGVVFVAGVTMLMAGAVLQQTVLGIVGFVVMVASAYVGLVSWRGRNAPDADPQPAPQQAEPFGLSVIEGGRKPRRTRQRRRSGGSGFMQRMDERWRRRRDDLGGF